MAQAKPHHDARRLKLLPPESSQASAQRQQRVLQEQAQTSGGARASDRRYARFGFCRGVLVP